MRALSRALSESRLVQEIVQNRGARISLIVGALFFFIGAFGPVFAPYDPYETHKELLYQTPSLEHFFGTDGAGRDVFSRVLYATRISAIIAFVSSILGGLILTLTLASIAGYYGGWRDRIILSIGDIFAIYPSILILLFLSLVVKDPYHEFLLKYSFFEGLLKSGIADVMLLILVLSLVGWLFGMLIFRARILQLRESGFVKSSRALGATHIHCITRHIIPNLGGLIMLSITGVLGAAIVGEIALSFLGLGIEDPHPSFGLMLAGIASPRFLNNHLYLFVAPAIVIVPWLYAIELLGTALGKAAESRRSL